MPRANRRSLLAYTLLFLLSSGSWGQEVSEGLTHLVIPDGTPVKLQMIRTISSAHAREGDRLDFVVVKDVTVGGSTIIQAGTVASGSVVKVEGKRLLGIGGKVVIKLEFSGPRHRRRGCVKSPQRNQRKLPIPSLWWQK